MRKYIQNDIRRFIYLSSIILSTITIYWTPVTATIIDGKTSVWVDLTCVAKTKRNDSLNILCKCQKVYWLRQDNHKKKKKNVDSQQLPIFRRCLIYTNNSAEIRIFCMMRSIPKFHELSHRFFCTIYALTPPLLLSRARIVKLRNFDVCIVHMRRPTTFESITLTTRQM